MFMKTDLDFIPSFLPLQELPQELPQVYHPSFHRLENPSSLPLPILFISSIFVLSSIFGIELRVRSNTIGSKRIQWTLWRRTSTTHTRWSTTSVDPLLVLVVVLVQVLELELAWDHHQGPPRHGGCVISSEHVFGSVDLHQPPRHGGCEISEHVWQSVCFQELRWTP